MRRIAEPLEHTTDFFIISGPWRFKDGDIIEFPSTLGDIHGAFIIKQCGRNTAPCSRCCLYMSGVNCPRVYTRTSVRRLCDKVPNGYLENIRDVMEEL